MQNPNIPFKILALAPFCPPVHAHRFDVPIRVDKLSVDQVIETLDLTFFVSMPRQFYADENLEIKIRTLKDFRPDGLIQSNPIMRNIWEARGYIAESKKKGLSADEINTRLNQWPNLPPIRMEPEPTKPPRQTGSVDSILDMVSLPDSQTAAAARPQDAIGQLDELLQNQLKYVFSNEIFRSLESSWRGLNLMLQGALQSEDLGIEIVPVHLDTLAETLDGLTAGLIEATPSLLLVDLQFDSSPRSISLLEHIAKVADTLLVPAITWVGPSFLHLDTWKDLKKLAYLPHYLEEPVFAKWQRLKELPAAQWLVSTCNRFLIRYPYGSDNPPRLVKFEEQGLLWASPVWALGNLITQSLISTGWPTQFTDWQRTRVEDLPLSPSDPEHPRPTETHYGRDRLDQLIRSGIIPLADMANKDFVFTPAETTVGGGSMSYQLFVSRITQLILWCRDYFPRDLAGTELETGLRQAFSRYWEACGQIGPQYLNISAGEPDADGRIPIRIELEPSRQILSSGTKVAMDFLW